MDSTNQRSVRDGELGDQALVRYYCPSADMVRQFREITLAATVYNVEQ